MNVKLNISVEDFFDLLLNEIEQNPNLRYYYRFLEDPRKFKFRKAYYIQRLQYIIDNIRLDDVVWDVGCGYGTTGIFLSLNGVKSTGTTLEFYFDQINSHLNYWKDYGDVSLFDVKYEDIKESTLIDNFYDVIIAQDTLHHLEPISESLDILNQKLKVGGKLIAIEENGKNIIQRIKLYKQRGNKRVKEYYDERLKKNIIMGDENIRSEHKWKLLFEKSNFFIDEDSIKYIRYYLYPKYRNRDILDVISLERSIRFGFKQKYFFFGLNFIGIKK